MAQGKIGGIEMKRDEAFAYNSITGTKLIFPDVAYAQLYSGSEIGMRVAGIHQEKATDENNKMLYRMIKEQYEIMNNFALSFAEKEESK